MQNRLFVALVSVDADRMFCVFKTMPYIFYLVLVWHIAFTIAFSYLYIMHFNHMHTFLAFLVLLPFLLIPFLFHIRPLSTLCHSAVCVCVWVCTFVSCMSSIIRITQQECVWRVINRSRGLSFFSLVNRRHHQDSLQKTLLKTHSSED